MLALLAVALAGVAALLGYSAYTARGGSATQAAAATATANAATLTASQPTATPTPTATATATPAATATARATATANPIAALDAEAAASFRAAYLGAFADQSCSTSNARSLFAPGQTVYANLCTSGNVASGPMSVTILQGGATVFTMSPPTYLSPNASYFYYSTYGLPSGSYDVRISIVIHGQVAVAKDLPFTVG